MIAANPCSGLTDLGSGVTAGVRCLAMRAAEGLAAEV